MKKPHQVLQLEAQALNHWCNGEPDEFLKISSDDVVYFDPFLKERIFGLKNLQDYYGELKGKIFAHSHEIHDPVIQLIDSVAVLSFKFKSITTNNKENSWICTEVYQMLKKEEWKIIHTHWSLVS